MVAQRSNILESGEHTAALSTLLRTSDGEIMVTRHSTPKVSDPLLDELVKFDQECFPAISVNISVFGFLQSDVLYVARRSADNSIVGAVGMWIAGADGPAELVTASVVESERGKGIYQTLSYLGLADMLNNGIYRVTLTTQNANVEYGIEKVLSVLIGQGVISGYSISRVQAQRYFDCLIAGAANLDSRSERINGEYAMLDRRRGDAFGISITIEPANQ